ncbi:MAG: response regulator transcription factor [Phaeospirillum sp.]|nr:response regulator transcription factor [Phaeospirillum sp.]
MSGPSRILLIIADDMLRQTVAEHLTAVAMMTVAQAANADAGLTMTGGQDLIVVDEALTDLQGDELCRRLREQGMTTPLLLLSGSPPPNAGRAVDAIVTKPLRLATLMARITELLTRRPKPVEVRIGPWLFDADRRRLIDDSGTVVRLTDKEVAILCRLGHAMGEVVTREVLLTEVWSYSAQIATHTLETHIYRLRRKIEAGPGGAGLLLTENGGYRLVVL